MNLDAEAVAQLCKELDELRQTAESLCSEHGAARKECDEAQQRIGSLQAELRTVTTQRLEAESVSAGLATELAEARRSL